MHYRRPSWRRPTTSGISQDEPGNDRRSPRRDGRILFLMIAGCFGRTGMCRPSFQVQGVECRGNELDENSEDGKTFSAALDTLSSKCS